MGLAAALFAFALLFLALDLQSPDIVLWTGQRAVGTEQNGLVTFWWHHHAYTATTPGYGAGKAVSVYFPPGDPSDAIADSLPDRLTAIALFAVPVAAGVVLLAVGLTRKRRWARQAEPRRRVPVRQRPGRGLRRPAAAGTAGQLSGPPVAWRFRGGRSRGWAARGGTGGGWAGGGWTWAWPADPLPWLV